MRDMDAEDRELVFLFLSLSVEEPTPKYPVEELGSNLGGLMYGVGVGGVKAHDWLYCGNCQEKDGGGVVDEPELDDPLPLPDEPLPDEPLPLPPLRPPFE